ncbi:hypothetical protein [Halalkalibacter oceani]|uniref:hypothetical protein n=1 Tax=Halalkalibacter oceani TaxID=1653776 RepID=UPI003392B435
MEQEYIMRELFSEFAQDETILRLLFYPSKTRDDDVRVIDENRPPILQMEEDRKWGIIYDVIKASKIVSDLDASQKCRLLYYMGRRPPKRNNYMFSDQQVVIDLLVHAKIDNVDFRLSKLVDYTSNNLFQKPMKFGNLNFAGGYEIGAPKDYIGYQLRFEVISSNG